MNDAHQDDPAGLLIGALQDCIEEAKAAPNDRGSIVSLCMEIQSFHLPALLTVLRHHPSLGAGAADHRKPLGIDLEQAGRG